MSGKGSDFHWAPQCDPSLTLFSWWSCRGDDLSFHTRGGSKVVGVWLLQGDALSLSHGSGRIRANEIAVRPAAGVGWGDTSQTSLYSFLRILLDLGVLVKLTSELRDLDLASFLQHRVMLLNQESLVLGSQEWMMGELEGGTASRSILTIPKPTWSLKSNCLHQLNSQHHSNSVSLSSVSVLFHDPI